MRKFFGIRPSPGRIETGVGRGPVPWKPPARPDRPVRGRLDRRRSTARGALYVAVVALAAAALLFALRLVVHWFVDR